MKKTLTFLKRIVDGSFKGENKEVGFLVGGVQKGGTTALDSYLRSHPEVCLAQVKEVHFFDNEFVFRFPSFVRDAWYQSHFHGCEPTMRKGEATPIYIWWHDAIKRIYNYNPKMKLVFVFRDPVSRAYSHWNMEIQRGNEVRPFSEVIREPFCKDTGANHDQHRIFSYVDRGFYHQQIKNVYDFFRKDQVLCLKQEDLQEFPSITLGAVARHIGIAPFCDFEEKRVHSRVYESEIDPRDREYLKDIYREDLVKFSALTGLNVCQWIK